MEKGVFGEFQKIKANEAIENVKEKALNERMRGVNPEISSTVRQALKQ